MFSQSSISRNQLLQFLWILSFGLLMFACTPSPEPAENPVGEVEEVVTVFETRPSEPTVVPIETATSTAVAPPTNTPPATQIPIGELHIISEPEGALASIASEGLTAQTPVDWAMSPGTYTVTLFLEGYEDWTTSVKVGFGSKTRLTATLYKQYTITPLPGGSDVQWSEDGQSLTYSQADEQWPAHVLILDVYRTWWRYDVATGDIQALPSLQTRVTNAVRESLGVCPFPLPETAPFPYPCWTTLQESPSSNRIVFESAKINGENTWLANIDGLDVIYLDKIPSGPQKVKWSSDDRWLLIGVYAGVDCSEVYYLVSIDGAFVEDLGELTNTDHWLVKGPAPEFSPDGQKVAFVGIETGGERLTAGQLNEEEPYSLYVLDLNTLEHHVVSPRFGMFQWSRDGNGLYILDGSGSMAGHEIDYLLDEELNYTELYYIDESIR